MRAVAGGVAGHAVVDELIAEEAATELLAEDGGEGVVGALVGEGEAGLAVVVLTAAETEWGAG